MLRAGGNGAILRDQEGVEIESDTFYRLEMGEKFAFCTSEGAWLEKCHTEWRV